MKCKHLVTFKWLTRFGLMGTGMLLMAESIKGNIIKHNHFKHHWQRCIMNSGEEIGWVADHDKYSLPLRIDYCSVCDGCESLSSSLCSVWCFHIRSDERPFSLLTHRNRTWGQISSVTNTTIFLSSKKKRRSHTWGSGRKSRICHVW